MFDPRPRTAASWRQPYPWLLALGLPLFAWILFGPRGTEVQVAEKRWWRAVQIERQVLEMQSDWCARMPAEAQAVSRQPRQDPSGERGLADYCRFRTWEWRTRRGAVREGQAPQPPAWPEPAALQTAANERLGKRLSRQELLLRDAGGREWTCRLPLEGWQSMNPGQSLRLQVDRHGVADCSSLLPPR